MTATATAPAPYRSATPVGRDGFPQLLHAEWTKLRTVRGWLIGLGLAALVMLLIGLLSAAGSQISCGGDPGGGGKPAAPGGPGGSGPRTGSDCRRAAPPTGPDGEAVSDNFYFVHRPLAGDGSITVRVTSLTRRIPAGDSEPWAKAGLMIKDGTAQGSTYAAVMVTGSHGVRFQHDFVHDTAGAPGAVSAASPRWLRLTRSGDTVTGYASSDGSRWSDVGSVTLAGLPATAQAGLFAASPAHEETKLQFGSVSSTGGPTLGVGTFDDVDVQGGWRDGAWSGDAVGGDNGVAPTPTETFEEAGGRFTIAASGDVGPFVVGPPSGPERNLIGAFAGLIAVIVVGTLFVTAEYRRGLVRTTFTASPRRGRVLAAKAVVLAGATFVVGLAGTLLSMWLVGGTFKDHGELVPAVPWLTVTRVVVGTAALLAVTAVLALAVGAILRRSAGAVAIVVGLVVVPYILSVASMVPLGAAEWLLRVTPAAAFAVQQSFPAYAHALGNYTPPNGFYPLPPWAGFGVLCLWTAAALALATVLVRRRDA